MGEKQAPQVERDLWGRPGTYLRDRRGRPCYRKTPENQDFVAHRVAQGWKQEDIAAALGCDEKTLRKNFSRELSEGARIVERELFDALMVKARQGNVSAIREARDWLREASLRDRAPLGKPARPAPLGKKAQVAHEATKPAGEWGDLPLPGVSRPN